MKILFGIFAGDQLITACEKKVDANVVLAHLQRSQEMLRENGRSIRDEYMEQVHPENIRAFIDNELNIKEFNVQVLTGMWKLMIGETIYKLIPKEQVTGATYEEELLIPGGNVKLSFYRSNSSDDEFLLWSVGGNHQPTVC